MIIGTHCENCGDLLKACNSTFMSMDFIHNTIRRRNLPFVDNLYLRLGSTELDGMQNFADIVLEAKNEFEQYNSLIIKMIFNDVYNNRYKFEDNFIKWLHDEIPASDVVFKPSSPIQMTNVVLNMPSVRSASQWSYDATTGELYTVWSTFRFDYETPYPYICDISTVSSEQTPVWTNESGIYLVKDRDYFIDQVSLNVLQRISEYNELINMDGFTGQMQLGSTIDRLRTKVENNRINSVDLYYKWRNR